MGRLKGRREFLKGAGILATGIAAKATTDILGISSTSIARGQIVKPIFYVDAINGKNSNSGLSPSEPWQSVEKVNSFRFEPGSQILFRRGQTFNDASLIPEDSGLPGSPITYGSFGNARFRPIIRSTLILRNFSNIGGNIWVTNFDGVGDHNDSLKIARNLSTQHIMRGRRSNLEDVRTNGDFWHDTDNHLLYMYSNQNPSNGIEVPRKSILGVVKREWLVFETLRFDLANDFCVIIANSNFLLRRCTISNSASAGIQTPAHDLSHCELDENEVFGCSGTGIQVNSSSARDNFLIQRNLVHHNCLDIVDGRFDALNYTGGIKVLARGSGKNLVIQGNRVWANGNITANVGKFAQSILKGAGIYVDSWLDGGVKVRYNRVFNNMFAGIMLENTSQSWVYGNIVYKNGRGGNVIGKNNGTVGISINRLSHHNRILHNTVYENEGTQISIHGPVSRLEFSNHNQVKNNIAIPGNGGKIALRVFSPNASEFGTNEISHNNFGPERPGFIEWGSRITPRGPRSAPLDTYAQFEAQYAADTSFGAATKSVVSGPSFVDALNGNFRLKTDSMLTGAGEAGVQIENDIDGLPYGDPPTIGAHAASE